VPGHGDADAALAGSAMMPQIATPASRRQRERATLVVSSLAVVTC